MITYWDILIGLTAAELLLAVALLSMIARLARRPIGARLVLLSLIFVAQSILGLLIYNHWRNMGYGPEISIPLIALQLTVVAGTIVLIDITRL